MAKFKNIVIESGEKILLQIWWTFKYNMILFHIFIYLSYSSFSNNIRRAWWDWWKSESFFNCFFFRSCVPTYLTCLSIGGQIFLDSVFPVVIFAVCLLLFTQVHILPIYPDLHWIVLLVINIEFENQWGCKLWESLAINCCCLSFPVQLFNTVTCTHVQVSVKRDNVEVMSR